MVELKNAKLVEAGKMLVKYEVNGKLKENKRKAYDRKQGELKGYKIVIIEGHQFAVKFNENNFASEIKYRGLNNQITKDGSSEPTNVKADKVDVEKLKKQVADKEVTFKLTKVVTEKIKAAQVEQKQEQPKQVKHMKFEDIKSLVNDNIAVYLYGPAGSGKNHVLKQVAEELGLDFYFTNSVQQEFKITGFVDAGGKYHETEFYRAWTKGGLFFLDELDASIPEVVTLLNAALANGYFDFNNGEGTLYANKNFRVVAAGNTVGTGADEQYTGRMQLDAATLDRFWFEEFDYDMNIELAIAKGNKELVDFIRDLRKQAKDKGISAVFSYRCIIMVTKMENKMSLEKILKGSVVKGLDKDTINTLNTNPANKYSKALWELKKAM